MNTRYIFLQKYLFFFILLLTSCQDSSTFKRPDVSHINIDIKIERFDQALLKLKAQDIINQNLIWQSQYGAFYTDYMREMLEVGDPKDSVHIQRVLSLILQQKEFKDLGGAVQKKYPTLAAQEKQLNRAFKYIKYYFPAYELPRFISFFAGFSFQTPVGDGYTGIGLDMFLGADSPFYPALVQSIPRYVSKRFTPENIVPRVIETTLREEIFPEENLIANTLQQMIYNGKILYAMDICLEEATDESKIGYTKEQLQWANRYQSDIWAWFMQEDLLYSTDFMRIQKYFSEAPFTPELGENNESAPKLGTFIGWMIVRKYMDRHPELTLVDLFENKDAQAILEASKYKGK